VIEKKFVWKTLKVRFFNSSSGETTKKEKKGKKRKKQHKNKIKAN